MGDKMKIKIIVACHKPYNVPKSNIFYPIEVGAINHQNNFLQLRDDLGDDNISKKNSSYCELTAIYWAWKNMDYDVIGLCHYRRYFSIKRKILFDNIKYIIDEKHIKKALDKYDFILPRLTKMKVSNYDHGNFYMENGKVVIYNDHHFDITRDVIKEYYPDHTHGNAQYFERFDLFPQKYRAEDYDHDRVTEMQGGSHSRRNVTVRKEQQQSRTAVPRHCYQHQLRELFFRHSQRDFFNFKVNEDREQRQEKPAKCHAQCSPSLSFEISHT